MLRLLKKLFENRDAESRIATGLQRAGSGSGASRGHLGDERFRLMVESVRDYAIFMLDPQGRVATWNAGAGRLKGYAADEIIGQHFSRFYPQEALDRGWPDEELQRATAEGRIEDEGWRVRKDGTMFWANVVITALRDESGTLQGFAKVTRDLTERRQAEEQARRLLQEEAARKAAEEAVREAERQREQLHVTLSSIGDAVIVTDKEGDVTFLNPVATGLTGWGSEEAAGQPLERIFPIINEETKAAVENPVQRVLREGRVVELANHTALVARDGREVPIEDTAAPIRGRGEGIHGVVLVFRDVTEARRAKEAMQYLAAIVESSDDAIIGQTLDGRIASWNRGAERLYGYAAGEVVGQPLAVLVPPDHPDEIPALIERFRRGEVIEHFETQRVRKDGSRLDVSLTISPVRDAEGRIIGASKIARDITDRKRAEAALREGEQRLAAELEATTRLHALSTSLLAVVDLPTALDDVLREAILVSRADFGNIQLYNPYTRALEVVAQRGFGEEFLDHFRTVRVDEGSCCARAMEGGERIIIEDVGLDPEFEPHRRIAASAGFRAVQSTPLKGRDGRILGMLSTHYRRRHRPSERDERLLDLLARHAADLIERLGFEEALRRSESRFRQLADAMPQIVWTARPDGEVDYYNRRWHEYTGLPEGVGNEGWRSIIHPEDRPPAVERWSESLRSVTAFELEIRLREGATGGYRWHLIRTVPVIDDAGAIVRWYGTATDIDEQKRAGQSARFLAEAGAALATIVEPESTLQRVANLAVPYFADWAAVDVAGEGGSLRRLAVAHREPEKVRLAQELMERYPPDPDAAGGSRHVFRTGESVIVEDVTDEMLVKGARDEDHLRLIRSLGLVSYMCVPLIVSGEALGVLTFATAESGRMYCRSDLALAEDLSHRAAVAIENARLYGAMQEEDRRKNEFLATLAHELRNPLAPLRNGLQVLRLAGSNRDAAEQARTMMERQMQHLVRLVDDLLDLSRISRGKVELRKERIGLSAVVSSALETCDPILRQCGHELTVMLPDDPVYVDADKTRLAQVVCNLLSNAAKYSDHGSRIWLTVERRGDGAVISVRDTGMGIPAPMLSRVFDMFTQVDRSLERSHGGLGIGLAIVKRLVEMHGGSVEARSEGHGMGSEFIVRLPVVLSVVHEDREEGNERQARPIHRHRILVVDDNEDAASSLAMMLKLMGNEVRTAHDGEEGIAAAGAYGPDMIVLDIGMPRLNGFDACRLIREQAWGKGIFIVALTGWGQDEDKRRSQQAGFDDHLVKPVEPAALEKLLESVALRRAE